MAIIVEHFNVGADPTIIKDESVAADQLVERFKKDLAKYSKASGHIYVIHSVPIYGKVYGKRDIDILLIGHFENFKLDHPVKNKHGETINMLNIDSFICNLEVKGNVRITRGMDGYTAHYDKPENVSDQSFQAAFDFKDYIAQAFDKNYFMANFLWFRRLTKYELDEMRGGMKDNAFYCNFTFDDFIDALLLQADTYKDKDNRIRVNCMAKCKQNARGIIDFFLQKREAAGLTKTKFEVITNNAIDPQKLGLHVGEKFTYLEGRAGTGKTIHLLQLAVYLSNEHNKARCKLLTYNNALVCDIKRLIDYLPLPAEINGRTISISTTHSFFLSIMKELEVVDDIEFNDEKYAEKYYRGLNDLSKLIDDLLKDSDATDLKDVIDKKIDWDYILVDECQDWSELERDILFKLYGPKRIIVADGIDQFNENKTRIDWCSGVKKILQKKDMQLEMRQKANLVTFVNAFAKKCKVEWNVQPNYDIPGGSVVICANYSNKMHRELQENCRGNDCENYDILVLVPPYDVENGEFKHKDAYKRAKIDFFDGVSPSNRKNYPVVDVCRLFPYDSCRGLEGWCVVCSNFDKLIEHKQAIYNSDDYDEEDVFGLNPKVIRDRHVYLWSLISLTRPVDTLVITLNDPDSEVGKKLHELADSFPSFVTWKIKK